MEAPSSPAANTTAAPVQVAPTPSPAPTPDYRQFLPSCFDQLPPEKQEILVEEANRRAEALSRPPEPLRCVSEVPPSLVAACGIIDLVHARTAIVQPAPPSREAGPPAYLTDVSFVSSTEGFGVTYYGGINNTADAGDT